MSYINRELLDYENNDNEYDSNTINNRHQTNQNRLLVTNEGLLDPALLKRTEGYMYKKGGAVNQRGGFKNWKKRWFVIVNVDFLGSEGYELRYYDAPRGNLKGTVGLSEIELFIKDSNTNGKKENRKLKYEFQILLQNGGTLELSCDDIHEREEWIETINMIIAYHRKILTSSSMTLDGYDPLFDDEEVCYQLGSEIAQNCQAYGPALFGSEAGQQSHLIVQIYDRMGQQVTKGGMPIVATLTNDACLYYLRILDNNDGSFFAQYMMGCAGKYKLSICVNDEHHIFGSPFDIEVLPSRTIARFCVASGSTLQSVALNSIQTFTIQAMDGYGNQKTKGGDPFEVGVMGSAQLKDLVDNADGTYTCTIQASSTSSALTSSLMITVTLLGKPIHGSPFKPIVVENPFDTTKSTSITSTTSPAQQRNLSINNLDTTLTAAMDMAISAASSSGGAVTGGNIPQQVERRPSVKAPPSKSELPAPLVEKISNTNNSNNNHNNGNTSTSLSRLERSRQRAMLAKSLAEGTAKLASKQTNSNTSSPNNNSVTSIHLPSNDFNKSPGTKQMKLEELQQDQQHGNSNNSPIKRNTVTHATQLPLKPMSKDQLGSIRMNLQLGLGIVGNHTTQSTRESISSPIGIAGIVKSGGPPPNATQNEMKIWDHTHKAFLNDEVLKLLTMHVDVLKQLFDLFSGVVEGVQVIKLSTTNNNNFNTSTTNNNSVTGGLYRLLECYDIIPTYLSKVEAKVLFALTSHAQKNLKSPASIAGGGTGLDFIGFIKFLVMVSYHSLTKTNAYSSMYHTIESKIEVMLYKWALADELKLQVVTNNLFNTDSSL